MKFKNLVLAFLAGAAFTAAFAFKGNVQQREYLTLRRWQPIGIGERITFLYPNGTTKEIKISDKYLDELHKIFNQLGDEGWELKHFSGDGIFFERVK